MSRLTDRKIVLITRETRLDELVRRHNTREQAAFYVKSRGDDFSDFEQEDRVCKAAISKIESDLRTLGLVQRLDRNFLPNFLFGPEDVVVVAGQDGLVANTLKYLKGQPVVAVNPAPERFDGVLLPFKVADIRAVMAEVLRSSFKSRSITMAEATTNDGQRLLAVNDFFIGPRLPVSARYEIEIGGKHEVQSSSGIIVSTGLGSTGWMKSVVTGALAVAGQQGAAKLLAWDAKELHFAVREPFPSRVTGTSLVYGAVTDSQTLVLTSRTAGGAVMFSDGVVGDAIEFNAGSRLEIRVSSTQGTLVAA
ncbi:MAG: sugar kinase [Pseudomonadota bacterium]